MDQYVITQKCVGTCDTACVDVCPVDCIHGPIELSEIRAVEPKRRKERFGSLQLYIDPDECIWCGACEPECPVEAIYPAEEVPERHRADIKRNADFFGRVL